MDTQTESKLDTFLLLQPGIKVSHSSKNSQPRAYCSLGIIFVRLGIAEVHEKPISEQLGDMSFIALDNFGADVLVCPYHIPPVFRVELAGEFGGIDQVAEHDGELTAFSFGGMRGNGWRCDLCR